METALHKCKLCKDPLYRSNVKLLCGSCYDAYCDFCIEEEEIHWIKDVSHCYECYLRKTDEKGYILYCLKRELDDINNRIY